MTTIIFDGDTMYSDTQATRMRDGKMVGAFTIPKISVTPKETWAASGSMLVAELYHCPWARFCINRRWRMYIFDIDTEAKSLYADVARYTTIISVTKRHARVINIRTRCKTMRFFKYRLHVLWADTTIEKNKRSDIEWITIGSGRDYAEHHLEDGYSPEVAIKLAAIDDVYTNSLVHAVPCK